MYPPNSCTSDETKVPNSIRVETHPDWSGHPLNESPYLTEELNRKAVKDAEFLVPTTY